jgi:D-alanyl-D-alanine carboxypeptidase (penicillin-binding protein 5/6)
MSLMLVESSNDAAFALAQYAGERGVDFVARMNSMAAQLGMRTCEFEDPAGLRDTAHCTASDVGRLMLAIWREHPDLLTITRSQTLSVPTLDGVVHTASTTNQLLATMSKIVGGKTGNTEGALGCLVLLVESQENHGTLMSVVLGSRARFVDTTSLLKWVTTAYHTTHD